MDNRETSTPSSDDPILKRHLFSGVTIKGRGDVGRVYFVRRPSRQSFGFRVAASSGPILKAPGSAGGYLHDWRIPPKPPKMRWATSPSLCLLRHCHRCPCGFDWQGARAAFLCDVTCLFPLTGIRKKAGSYQPFSSYIFFDFIIPISMALFMCSLHPAMSFCDIEDFAEVISCIPIILFSPSGIFISMASALSMFF